MIEGFATSSGYRGNDATDHSLLSAHELGSNTETMYHIATKASSVPVTWHRPARIWFQFSTKL